MKTCVFSGVNLKHIIICLLFFFSLIKLNAACAFFQSNDHPDGIRLDHTAIGRSTQDIIVYQLYDNFLYANPDNFLIKHRAGFISADEVKINVPLKILARDSIYPENSIDRILLANLRIKKLMIEYSELQKKARLLLDDGRISLTGEKKKKSANDDPQNGMDDIESEKERIDKKLINIRQLSQWTLDDISSNETRSMENDSNLNHRTTSLPADTFYNADFSAGVEKTSDVEKTDAVTVRQIFSGKKSTELPWIFTLFLKILNYVLNNRVEIILYMIFIAVVGYFISLQVRR